jgi:hypothetical protein
MDWRDNYHVICFLCGLRYATLELCFLCCPCGAYITISEDSKRVRRLRVQGQVRVSLVNCEDYLSTD